MNPVRTSRLISPFGLGFLFLFLFLVPRLVIAEEPQKRGDNDEEARPSTSALDEWLDALESSRKGLKTLHARFEEKRTSFLFQMEETATGQLFYERPLRLFWRYEDPEPIDILVENKELKVFKPDLMQLEIFSFDRDEDFRSLFLSLEDSPRDLKTRYEVELISSEPSGDTVIRLTPKQVKAAETAEESDPESKGEAGMEESASPPFLFAEIRFSGVDMLPRHIRIRNSEEKETEVTFTKFEKNVSFEPETFALDIPQGTEVIRYGEDSGPIRVE